MLTTLRVTLLSSLCFAAGQASSFNIKQGTFLIEAGGFNSSQGKTQNVFIESLLGDKYSVTQRHDNNALFGLGYLLGGAEMNRLNINYGVNTFYFLNTKVSGIITQEFLFDNLAYSYKVNQLPVYATVKVDIKDNSNNYAITLDTGVGPNFIKTNHYYDRPLDNSFTIPDDAFRGQSNVAFSAMAGIGLKINNAIGNKPVECGYRFFYLGEASLKPRTSQILNSLKTGHNYANALLCTVAI